MGASKEKEKELALALFMSKDDITFKEIAEKVGVSVNTITAWASKSNWNDLKTAHLTTSTQTVKMLQDTLSTLASINKEKARAGAFTKNDADIIRELTTSIESLKGGFSLSTYVQVMDEFMQFIPNSNNALRSTIADYQEGFLLKKASDAQVSL